MPLDPAFVGRTYPPTRPYEVGREKIREFADAINDPNPLYRDAAAARAAGHDDVVAPPTFAVLLSLNATAQLYEDGDLGIDYSRVVHGDERFVHHRPIVPGDVLHVVVTIETIRAAGGNDIVGTRGEVRDAHDELVTTAYMTVVARGTAA